MESNQGPITVWIRKGTTSNNRLIAFSFHLANIPMSEILGAGFAYDGNSVVYEATPLTRVVYFEPDNMSHGKLHAFLAESGEEDQPMPSVLNWVQVMIRDWFSAHGLTPFFT